jgi:hypothetical protein
MSIIRPFQSGAQGRGVLSPLLECASNAEFFRDPAGRAFAYVPCGDHREACPLEGADFRMWLQRRYFEQLGGPINKRDVDDAVLLFAAKAKYEGHEQEVFCRTAKLGEALYLDLGDESWEAVEVTNGGWRIVPQPEVRFVRPQGLLPLKRPCEGPGVETRFQELFRLSDDQLRLLAVWLLSAMHPQGPHPILRICGEGSSQLALALRSLIDAHAVPVRGNPREERDLMIGAAHNWLVVISLHRMPGWLADWLCHLHTGTGLAARRLYFDDAEIVFSGQHPVILVSDESVPLPGAVRDISVTVTLPPLGPRERRTESEFRAALEQIRAPFLGYLLDTLYLVIALKGHVPPVLPRLTEFALVGARAELVSWPSGSFASAYAAGRIDSPAIGYTLRLVAAAGKWVGTATVLLKILTDMATPTERSSDSWPQTAAGLSKELRAAKTLLGDFGVSVEFWREPGGGRNRSIILTATGQGE